MTYKMHYFEYTKNFILFSFICSHTSSSFSFKLKLAGIAIILTFIYKHKEHKKKHITMAEMFHLIYINNNSKKNNSETIDHAQIPNGMLTECFQNY